MRLWYSGLLQVIALIIICMCYYCVYRKEISKHTVYDAICYVLVGKFAICIVGWMVLAILACLFIQVRNILMYVNIIAFVVLFILWVKNMPIRLDEKRNKAKRMRYNIEDFFKNFKK